MTLQQDPSAVAAAAAATATSGNIAGDGGNIASDNEAGERSAREQLKRATIASAKGTGPGSDTANGQVVAEHQQPAAHSADATNGVESRKTAPADSAAPPLTTTDSTAYTLTTTIDSTSSEPFFTQNTSTKAVEEVPPQLDTSAAATSTSPTNGDFDLGSGGGGGRGGGGGGGGGGNKSPRKKRSRDQLDVDADRDAKKIIATEEARAQRLSAELDRSDDVDGAGRPAAATQARATSPSKSPAKSTFGVINRISAPATGSQQQQQQQQQQQKTVTSSSAFAASGFAAMANSTASPFGSFGGGGASTSSNPAPSPFGALSSSAGNTTTSSSQTTQTQSSAAGKTFGSFASSTASPFATTGASGPSPFASALATSNQSSSSAFGSSAFGGTAFGNALAGGSKLTSFAAPKGDTKFGDAAHSVVRPIGSPSSDKDDNDENDGDDDDDNDENEQGAPDNDEGKKDSSHRHDDAEEETFHLQDVDSGERGETTIFSSRSSLFAFKDSAWKESGKGIFKFNVTSPPNTHTTDTTSTTDSTSTSTAVTSAATSAPAAAAALPQRKQGRFIMRAHQTFRVLLNAAVFKQMKVGDSRGGEPASRSFSFAVIETGGRLAPYMVKLADVRESRALWKAVKDLQDEL